MRVWPLQPPPGHGAPAAGSFAVQALLAGVLAGLSCDRCRAAVGRKRSQRGGTTRAAKAPVAADAFDVERVRRDFPALMQQVRPGVPLVYLDNAATSQKPARVLAKLDRFYSQDNSNVHRGMHTLSMRSTEAFEGARAKVAKFINAANSVEVIFTRNATEAINLVARSWGMANIGAGDEILLTVMEHHSNLVPWQQLAETVGANLRFVGLTPEGMLNLAEFEHLLCERTRLVSMCHVSNVLGCVNPVEWAVERAHAVGAKVLLDACQSVPHMPVNVRGLGVDWLVASSHKMCGPTGIGFLWGRAELLRASPPFLGGGEMIDEVSLERSTYADIPHKLEAGTPAFAEAVALGAACDYLSDLGMERVSEQEHLLTGHLWQRVAELPGVSLYGPPPSLAPDRAALLCFNIEGCHPNDLATLVDQDRGVAMRAGHHCTQPLHKQLGLTASARLSAYFYNTTEEIDTAVSALREAINMLRGDMASLDLFAVDSAPAAARRWGVDVGPPTVLEALRERGLVERTSWTVEGDSPLAQPGSTSRVCAAFAPTSGSLRLRDLPKLAFLRWCRLYGHTPVCLISSSAVRAGRGPAGARVSAEDLQHNSFRLRGCLERALEDDAESQAVVVDDLEWLSDMSVLEFVHEVGHKVQLDPWLEQAGRDPGSGHSLAELAGPLLQGWSFSLVQERHGVTVQAGSQDEWTAMSVGLGMRAQDSGDAEASHTAGFLTLVPVPTEGFDLEAEQDHLSSPDDLCQLLLGVQDADVPELLRRLTLLPLADVEAMVRSMKEPGYERGTVQRRLAEEAVRLAFGHAALSHAKLPLGAAA